MFVLSKRSLRNLKGVHPLLYRVVVRALSISEVDFACTEGVRTKARQRELYAQGRTKPGPKVTWTLDSRHFIDEATGFGLAVDLCPAPYDYRNLADFDRMAAAVFKAAELEGAEIRWGADWDRDGNPRERGESDSPHFELVLA